MARRNIPLFVRLPKQQATALDRLSEKTGRPKQHLVSELIGERLRPATLPVGRIDVAAVPDVLSDSDTVLTLEEAAALLKLSVDVVRSAVEDGDLPARRFGSEWRFSKRAVLAWLGDGDRTRNRNRR